MQIALGGGSYYNGVSFSVQTLFGILFVTSINKPVFTIEDKIFSKYLLNIIQIKSSPAQLWIDCIVN